MTLTAKKTTTALNAVNPCPRRKKILTVQNLIELLSNLPPTANVLIENDTEFVTIDTVMDVGKVLPLYPGSKSHIEAEPGEGGNLAFVLK